MTKRAVVFGVDRDAGGAVVLAPAAVGNVKGAPGRGFGSEGDVHRALRRDCAGRNR